MESEVLKSYLASLKLEEPQEAGGLSLFPLLGGLKSDYHYLVLDEALERETLVIREKEEEEVAEIEIINKGKEDVLILEGEEVVGAKQNRTFNLSILVAGESQVKVPVSCVEEGRWFPQEEGFVSKESFSFPKLRKVKMASVVENLEEGEFRADQQKVWEKVSEKMEALEVESPTRAMHDLYLSQGKRLKDLEKNFKILKGQVGAVFSLGRRILGMDVFDRPLTYKKLERKIVKSYLLEALAENPGGSLTQKDILSFLEKVESSRISSCPSPGKGKTFKIEDKNFVGISLFTHSLPLHTAVFWLEEEKKEKGLLSFSRRRSLIY